MSLLISLIGCAVDGGIIGKLCQEKENETKKDLKK